jgi:hypothetical protein
MQPERRKTKRKEKNDKILVVATQLCPLPYCYELLHGLWRVTKSSQPANTGRTTTCLSSLHVFLRDECKFMQHGERLWQPVSGVLDESYNQLIRLSGVAVQARQSTQAVTVFILCSLAGWCGYSAERA